MPLPVPFYFFLIGTIIMLISAAYYDLQKTKGSKAQTNLDESTTTNRVIGFIFIIGIAGFLFGVILGLITILSDEIPQGPTLRGSFSY